MTSLEDDEMNLSNWMPLNDLDRLLNRFYPMSTHLDDDFPGLRMLKADIAWRPAAHITETKDELLIYSWFTGTYIENGVSCLTMFYLKYILVIYCKANTYVQLFFSYSET